MSVYAPEIIVFLFSIV